MTLPEYTSREGVGRSPGLVSGGLSVVGALVDPRFSIAISLQGPLFLGPGMRPVPTCGKSRFSRVFSDFFEKV